VHLFHALPDETRVRIIERLRGGELVFKELGLALDRPGRLLATLVRISV